MFYGSSTYFNMTKIASSSVNSRHANSIPNVPRNGKSSCGPAMNFILGLLFDYVKFPQKVLRQFV